MNPTTADCDALNASLGSPNLSQTVYDPLITHLRVTYNNYRLTITLFRHLHFLSSTPSAQPLAETRM